MNTNMFQPSNIQNSLTKAVDNIPGREVVENTVQQATQKIGEVTENVSDTMKEFSNPAAVAEASKEYLNSNSLVAKLGFLLLIVILFLILFQLGITLITYLSSQAKQNAYLIYGQANGSNSIQITQNPANAQSVTLYRSNNKSEGAVFTFSLWLNVTGISTPTTQYAHIFNVGNNTYDPKTGIATVNNAPGLYLANTHPTATGNNNPANTATLHVVMDTVQNNPSDLGYQTIDVGTFPLKKWVHVALRLENNIVDVYINGTMTERLSLNSAPRLNYNDVFICQHGGFNGNISNLRYYSDALDVFQLQSIVRSGPNTNAAVESGTSGWSGNNQYLDSSWYLNNLR